MLRFQIPIDRTVSTDSQSEKENENSESSSSPSREKGVDVVESLKKEWSSMFTQLEQNYRTKLDEQQRLNDQKLQSLHEEIKKCFIEQQEKLIENQQKLHQNNTAQQQSPVSNPNSTNQRTVETSTSIDQTSDTEINTQLHQHQTYQSTTTNNSTSAINQSTIVDNAKYISNLRQELKNKHARHVQDLKDYYDKEIDDLKRQLNGYKIKYGLDGGAVGESSLETSQYEEYKQRYENLAINFDELKNTNETLLNKIKDDSDHIKYLAHENFDLTNKINHLEQIIRNLNEKCSSLEESSAHCESQLEEAIKLQDKYMRELQNEKRNLAKKNQECHELNSAVKFFEQKCDNYELKVDERDNLIARLKTKNIQLENDMTRLDMEYHKLRKSNGHNIANQQQPYIASNNVKDRSPSKPTQLPIRNQSKYQSNPNLSVINEMLVTPSNISPPTKTNVNHPQVNIYCNTSSNNHSSSSSSSSKSPRSRSPPTNNGSGPTRPASIINLNRMSTSRETIEAEKQNKASRTPQKQHVNDLNYQQIQQNQLYHQYQQHHLDALESTAGANTTNMSAEDRHERQHQQEGTIVVSNCTSSRNHQSSLSSTSYTTHSTSLQQQTQQHQSPQTTNNIKFLNLTPDRQIQYIGELENEFDMLMKLRQQLDAKLTRLPQKTTNHNMHAIREGVEEELAKVEKKLSSVKLELRKLNIIKTH